MQSLTARRTPADPDEIWVLEHPPVYTMGLKGRSQSLPEALHGTPLVQSDRGGDLTWHGPGQVVVYVLLDLRRLDLGIKGLVRVLEQAIIDFLATRGIQGERRAGAPGVYVGGDKIASLGLRIRNGCSYHGLAFNVDPDLSAFSKIDPCGYPGLRATSLRALGVADDWSAAADGLLRALLGRLGYNAADMDMRNRLDG